MSGVVAVAEIPQRDKITARTRELWGLGRDIADDLEAELAAVLLGIGQEEAVNEATSYDLDKVFVADSPLLASYEPGVCLGLLVGVCRRMSPDVVLMEQRLVGHELAPRLSYRLGSTAVTDCVEIEVNPGGRGIKMTKPIYGGVALGVFQSDSMPQVVTVRDRVGSLAEPVHGSGAEVIDIADSVDASLKQYDVVDRVKVESEGVRLEEAGAVVSGGRGMGGEEGFEQLERLARTLNGAVGASRPPCDAGWIDSSAQVGMTGKIVAPDLYIAVGISGASQHITGMRDSGRIVAINKDPEAPIFGVSHYGVVADYREVLPALQEKIKEFLSD